MAELNIFAPLAMIILGRARRSSERMRHLLAAALTVSLVASPVFAQVIELGVADAQPVFDEANRQGRVFVRLDREGASAFALFTRDHLQKRINILIDGEVRATPLIREPIVSGSFPLSGLSSAEAANALSARLKSGQSVLTVALAN
jgi:preprotein translocase subunit SecD